VFTKKSKINKMKTIKILFTAAVLLLTAAITNAQSDKTLRTIGIKKQTIKVSGVCSMDKRQIENAAFTVQGVKSAVWDEYTHVLTVTYSVFNSNAVDNIQTKISLAGNDTDKYRADNNVYQNLPDCCHYQRRQS
jgi:periplasmic mercuric ion binding protein